LHDPVDACVSCFSKLFSGEQNHAYDLAELGRYYARYGQLMNHWHAVLPPGSFIDVRYEDVVDDLESHARRIIAYCGLPWDDRCLLSGSVCKMSGRLCRQHASKQTFGNC